MSAYRFEFDRTVPLAEAEMSLHLATYAVEGLFGRARVRLEFGYRVDEAKNTLVVDASTEVGAAVVRVFTALLLREHGDEAFHVCRVEPHVRQATAGGRTP